MLQLTRNKRLFSLIITLQGEALRLHQMVSVLFFKLWFNDFHNINHQRPDTLVSEPRVGLLSSWCLFILKKASPFFYLHLSMYSRPLYFCNFTAEVCSSLQSFP